MTAGGNLNASSSSSSSFQLQICITDAERGSQIAFKQDGSRFKTSQKTLKFHTDQRYKFSIKCKPHMDFHSLHIAGSDLELVTEQPTSGEYIAIWNTVGIEATKKSQRKDILVVLSGPGKSLRRVLQGKFYLRNDNHADYGHKLKSLTWDCVVEPGGEVKVTDEQLS